MKLIRSRRNKTILASIFLLSSLFFILCGIFGAYERDVYSPLWFVIFYVYELIFFLGLKSGKVVVNAKTRGIAECKFRITKQGRIILLIFNVLAIISFLYFVYLYQKVIGFSALGTYTTDAFEEGRTSLEKITLLIIQMGGEMAYLIMYTDTTLRKTKSFQLAKVCLFLPGLRSLMLGNRYTIAVEFVLFFVTNWTDIRDNSQKIFKDKKKKIFIIVFGIVLLSCFMYLFTTRSIYYTALEKFEFYPGDQRVKPFWKMLYEVSDGKLDFLLTFSDYVTEAPYVFSYFCKYRMPEKILWGQLTFRSIMQILNTALGVGQGYGEVTSTIASGKYSGFGYILIADYGVYLAPFMAYIIGFIFSKIERYKQCNRVCASLFPLVMTICCFAPVYFFYVGRCDYPFLFTIFFAPLCIRKERT